MPSSGYTAWTVIAGETPTTAKWNLLGSNDASFNTGQGFNDNILLPRHFATTSAWVFTDWSASVVATGWSSLTFKFFRYIQLGKTVFVYFALEGTSNATSVTFTLPFAAKAPIPSGSGSAVAIEASTGLMLNNGAVTTAQGRMYIDISVNPSLMTVTTAAGSAGWIASGNKGVRGQFFYEIA